MSNEVFSRMESVYFVTGEGNSTEDAGGCTLQYLLDNGGFENFDPTSIMGIAGAPICFSDNAEYIDATGVITAGTPGDFVGAEAGMVIYLDGRDEEGRFEILEVDPSGNWIRLEAELNDEEDQPCDVWVGGAFDNMPNALGQITASDSGGASDCYIFTNKDGSEFSIDGGGSIANNTKLFIIGFNTTLLDMMPGGAYYQSAIDAWYLGIDPDCHVTFDFDDNDIFETTGESNIVLYNFYFKDGDGNSIAIDADSSGVVFFNCFASGSVKTVHAYDNNKAICFIECYIFDGSTNLIRQEAYEINMYFIDCVLDQVENDSTMIYCQQPDSTFVFSGCLITNGKFIFIAGGQYIEWNNTIIGHADNLQNIHRVNDMGGAGIRVSFNDIYIMPDAAKVFYGVGDGGTLISDRNCIWGNSGAYGGDFGYTEVGDGQIGRPGFKTIEADPEFDNDYRPRNPQILRGGSDGRLPLGASKQKYHFPQKARIVNHGRVGILK